MCVVEALVHLPWRSKEGSVACEGCMPKYWYVASWGWKELVILHVLYGQHNQKMIHQGSKNSVYLIAHVWPTAAEVSPGELTAGCTHSAEVFLLRLSMYHLPDELALLLPSGFAVAWFRTAAEPSPTGSHCVHQGAAPLG